MRDEDPSNTVVSKGPCPDCGSEDNLVTYADGHEHCFSISCDRHTPPREGFEPEDTQPLGMLPGDAVPFTTEYMQTGLKKRRIKLDTLKRFGYFVHKEGGKHLQIAPYYDQKGQPVYQKYRDENKNFWFTKISSDSPKTKDLQLYGQHVWGEKFNRTVVVTEGEHDAHAIAEARKFKTPAVSLVQGISNAADCLKANYRWLDRFDEIILWFDNDEPGQTPIAECANLFEPGKVKTIKVPNIKDASDLKQAGRDGDIEAAIYGAVTWSPEGIVNASDCVADMDEPEGVKICEYPWPKLEEITMGIREKEVIYHVAGTGVGKTSFIVEVQNMLLDKGIKFGIMRFEDTRAKTQMDIMSRRVKRRLHLEKTDKTFRRKLHTEVFGTGLVELFDPETADWSLDSILGYIRYMSKALDCKVIFVDPLSFVVAASKESDERKALDNVAYEFGRLVKQMDINLQITHHLNRGEGKAHEEGGQISLKNIRGSAGIANFSMGVFAYERNQQGERPDLTLTRVLKNRFKGTTGVADIIKWDETTGVLSPTDDPFPDNDSAAFGPAPDNNSPTSSEEY